MKLPITRLKLPAELGKVTNGNLPASLLVDCGIPGFKMSPRAAAAMKALVAAATAAGFKVRATGTYRSYEAQERLFRSRYTREFLPGRPSKLWEGKTWHQLPRTAEAATPGRSNHGLGLAVDFAETADSGSGVKSVSPAFVAWLVKNAARFGYSAELQSEPWHWRYVAGDNVPAEVAAFHAPAGVTLPPTRPAPAPAAPASPVLRRGARGDAVKDAQRLLNRAGFPCSTDGIFGPKTDAAVRAFQRARKMTVDGIVGRHTWAALRR
jgi:hypothetical protein